MAGMLHALLLARLFLALADLWRVAGLMHYTGMSAPSQLSHRVWGSLVPHKGQLAAPQALH